MKFNLANKLTILRILTIPILIISLLSDYKKVGFAIFLIAIITDLLDGLIARIAKQKTQLGTILDPLADKLLIATVFLLLVTKYRSLMWLAVLVISRDAILIIGTLIFYLTGNIPKIAPSFTGKCATVAQFCSLLLVLFAHAMEKKVLLSSFGFWVLLYITAGLTVVSGLGYIIQGSRYLTEQKPTTV